MFAAALLLTPLLASAPATGVLARPALVASVEVVEEFWSDGTVKLRYTVDDAGRRHGSYEEFRADGTPQVKARYAKDQLDGAYTSFHANGEKAVSAKYRRGALDGEYVERNEDGEVRVQATYKGGLLHGTRSVESDDGLTSSQTWKEGVLVQMDGFTPFPRSPEELDAGLRAIHAAPWNLDVAPDADPNLARERELGLRRLKAYRFLAGLRHADVVLVDELNELSQMAARLCHAIGRLDHTPDNPGWPEDEYRAGYEGTSHSNLAMSTQGGVARSVDSYMDDSDPSNIDRVGHRRHCLAPALRRTGFGKYGGFSAMWSMDRSGKAGKLDVVAFPSMGYHPVRYFGERHAWSLTVPGSEVGDVKDVVVRVHGLGEHYGPVGEALEIDHLGSVADTLVFRPVLPRFEAGAAYRVEVTGLPGRGKEPLRYLVEFVDL